MVFGKQFRPALGGGITSDRIAVLVMSLFLGLMLMLPLAGCGSGSGNNNGNNNNNNGGNNSTTTPSRITGRVVDQNNANQPVPGAIIRYGTVVTGTDNAGNFSMDVPSNQATTNLTVTGPAAADGSAAYYNSGFIGSQQYSLAITGYPVTPIAPGITLPLGDIIIFSQTGPPPPPIF